MPIKLIGTSHIAKQSIKEVRETILGWKPDIVCVELDHARFRNLMSSDKNKLTIRDIIRYGNFGFVFALVGQWLQKKLGERVGVIPGADMKTAITAARKVRARIYLVDQPIQKTLYNLSKKVSIWEKLRLVLYLLLGPIYPENRGFIKKINLNKVPTERLIEELTSSLKKRFPNIYAVLVADRNRYIAKAVLVTHKHNINKKIVVVVGAGHIRGIRNLISKNVF